MKKWMISFVFVSMFLFAMGAMAQTKNDRVVYFKSSMDCHACEKTLFDHLRFERGVKDLSVDLETNTVKIVYVANRSDEAALQKSIEKKGYEANKLSEDQYEKLLKTKTTAPQSTPSTQRQ